MLMGESVIGERGWVTMIRATVTRVCDAMFVSAKRTLSGGGLSYPFSRDGLFLLSCFELLSTLLFFCLPMQKATAAAAAAKRTRDEARARDPTRNPSFDNQSYAPP